MDREIDVKKFDELWHHITTQRDGVITVQERNELEYVFHLISGCESYLEVGTAEGNSLYVLSHALKDNARIKCIDYGESHTQKAQQEILSGLPNATMFHGNSHSPAAVNFASDLYDVVFIDAGHTYEDVIADAMAYGWMATKYIIFHDVCLEPVEKAFAWYCKQRPNDKAIMIKNSPTFGYGIIEVKK